MRKTYTSKHRKATSKKDGRREKREMLQRHSSERSEVKESPINYDTLYRRDTEAPLKQVRNDEKE